MKVQPYRREIEGRDDDQPLETGGDALAHDLGEFRGRIAGRPASDPASGQQDTYCVAEHDNQQRDGEINPAIDRQPQEGGPSKSRGFNELGDFLGDHPRRDRRLWRSSGDDLFQGSGSPSPLLLRRRLPAPVPASLAGRTGVAVGSGVSSGASSPQAVRRNSQSDHDQQ